MTEQQRREQIMKMRQQQMAAAATAPAMTDQEALRIAQEQGGITHEQVLMAAMLGKMVNSNLTDIKKADVGGSLKITGVDMSKVMPSGIAKAMGRPPQPQMPVPPPLNLPVPPQLEMPPLPAIPPQVEVAPSPQPMFTPPAPVVNKDTDQLELEFDKKARYDDIYKKLEELEDRIIALNGKADKILELLDKKKLKKAQLDGTQTC